MTTSLNNTLLNVLTSSRATKWLNWQTQVHQYKSKISDSFVHFASFSCISMSVGDENHHSRSFHQISDVNSYFTRNVKSSGNIFNLHMVLHLNNWMINFNWWKCEFIVKTSVTFVLIFEGVHLFRKRNRQIVALSRHVVDHFCPLQNSDTDACLSNSWRWLAERVVAFYLTIYIIEFTYAHSGRSFLGGYAY